MYRQAQKNKCNEFKSGPVQVKKIEVLQKGVTEGYYFEVMLPLNLMHS